MLHFRNLFKSTTPQSMLYPVFYSSKILLKLITYYSKLRKLPIGTGQGHGFTVHPYIFAKINEVTGNEETLGLLNLLLMECLCSDQNDKLFPIPCLYIHMGYDNINDPICSCTLPAFIRLTISTFQGYTLYCRDEIMYIFPTAVRN